MDSKEYSWKYIAADTLLCRTACDLIYAKLTPDTTSGSCVFHNGEDATGEVITRIFSAGLWDTKFHPEKPIYCRRGLYVSSVVTCGILVQWRPRASKEG